MLIFKHKRFHLWTKSEKLPDKLIKEAVQEMCDGLYDANLGGGVYKKRLPRSGQGKSGGYRTLILFKSGDIAIFVYGFAKNEKENISPREREAFKMLARYYLNLSDEELFDLIQNGELIQVKYHEKQT